MFRRVLKRDAVLWWQGDAATSVGLVDSGRLGIRVDKRLLDTVAQGAVVGEAALFDSGASAQPRAGDVVVLDDDTVVLEYTVAEMREAGCTDVHRRVLHSLSGQIARNHLLVAAASSSRLVTEPTVAGLLQGLARADAGIDAVQDWDAFMAAFRFLYHLRGGSDAARSALAPEGSWSLDAALQLLEDFRPLLGVQHQMATHLERLLRAEAQRAGGH